jgi:uncharacterized protein (TIGR00255 family)
MTGFGSAGASSGGYRAEVEMRAVNGRYLSLKVRMPGEFSSLEQEVRKLLGGQLGRGNIELRAEIWPEAGEAGIELDARLIEAYVKKWRALARRLKIEGELRLESLASMPELFAPPRRSSNARKSLPALSAAVKAALAKLHTMRCREGAALVKVLGGHLDAVERLRGQIARRVPEVAAGLVARAGERVRRILAESKASAEVRSEDLAREIAWQADRTDVSEEMDRLSSHVAQFRTALARGGEVGKRLDFLVQEMHREANTTGSKASDGEAAGAIVELKLQIEKLREQIQNLL